MLTNKPYNLSAGFNFQMPPVKLMLAISAVYFIWGSTYIALHKMIEFMPPFLANGTRFTVAGGSLLILLWLAGEPLPTRKQWRNAFVIGCLMMCISSGLLAYAIQYVASGLAALIIGAIPLWTALFASFWERRPTRYEMGGLVVGFIGIGILNFGTELWANPWGALALLCAPIIWAFATIWSRQLDMPKGMMSSATLLFTGGALLALAGVLRGESITEMPPAEALFSWGYLVVFGSMVAFSAYAYLVQNTSPALATSYAYVNPIIAVFLGWMLLNEGINVQTFIAGGLIIVAVMMITYSSAQRGKRATRMVKP